jgi:hypothetical protein
VSARYFKCGLHSPHHGHRTMELMMGEMPFKERNKGYDQNVGLARDCIVTTIDHLRLNRGEFQTLWCNYESDHYWDLGPWTTSMNEICCSYSRVDYSVDGYILTPSLFR